MTTTTYIDWQGVEFSIRMILRGYARAQYDPHTALDKIDDILAETVGRTKEIHLDPNGEEE